MSANGSSFVFPPSTPRPVLAGAAVPSDLLAPVVGIRKCRVTRPLRKAADRWGQWGRGWRVDLDAARKHRPPGAAPDAMVSHWVVEAPWSSEVIHSYSVVLVHLRFDFYHDPVTRYLDGATHEVGLIAIHPEAQREIMLSAPTDANAWLRPAVFGAQLLEPTDEAAAIRVATAVGLICDGRLSPHPTHARAWAELFGDNMLRVARAPVQDQEGED